LVLGVEERIFVVQVLSPYGKSTAAPEYPYQSVYLRVSLIGDSVPRDQSVMVVLSRCAFYFFIWEGRGGSQNLSTFQHAQEAHSIWVLVTNISGW
jgi:hypothetical protein